MNRLRLLASVTVVAATIGMLTACLPVPTRPLATVPFTLTVDGDRLAWFNCYEDPLEIEYFSSGIEGEVGGNETSVALFTGETEAGETVRVEYGMLSADPGSFPGMPVLEETDVRVSDMSGDVTVFLRLAGPEQRAEVAFKNVRAADLEDGSYIYHSGEIDDEPCNF